MLNKILGLFTLGLLLGPLASQGSEPEFHYQAPLSEATSEYRRVELPWEVLAHLLQADQADLQVVNAGGQAVPARISPIGDLELNPEERSLSFFRGDDPTQVGLLLTLDTSEASPKAPKPKLEQLAVADRHYLIVQNAVLDDKLFTLQSLSLAWDSQHLTQWLPKSLILETSDDLQTWQRVTTQSLPYILKEQAVLVENHRIEFAQPVQAKFLRLSGQADFAPILTSLQGVTGIAPQQTAQRIAWQTVPLLTTDQPQQFHYPMPVSVPVKQWRMHLAQSGDLYVGELTTRPLDERYGKQRNQVSTMSFVDYRLNSDLGELRAPAQRLPNIYDWSSNQVIDWHWTFTQPQPLAADKAVVEFGWQPLELHFIAQGQGPFRLVYGSRDPIPRLDLPFPDEAMAGRWLATTVQVGAEQVLKPLDDPAAYKQWLPYLLGGVLLAAVLLLLGMARHLWRDLNQTRD